MKVDIQVHHLEDILDLDKLRGAQLAQGLADITFDEGTDTFHIQLDREAFIAKIEESHGRAMQAVKKNDLQVDEIMEEMLHRMTKAYMFNQACMDFSKAGIELLSQIAKGYTAATLSQIVESCGKETTKDLMDLVNHLLDYKLKEMRIEEDEEVPY